MITKPTIYLHIGAGKTGSTTIQVWLKSVESALAESGYLIFDTDFEPGAQHDRLSNQQAYFHSVLQNGKSGVDAFHEKFRKNLDYMRENGYHSAVMSAENLINQWSKAHNWFAPYKDECNWKIIAYVRNQPYYIVSAWKEWGYWNKNFEESFDGQYHHANWFENIKPWDNTFGSENIYLGILEKHCLVDGLLHHDFASAINMYEITANNNELVYANPSINNQTALFFARVRQNYLDSNPLIKSKVTKFKKNTNESDDTVDIHVVDNLQSMFHYKPLVIKNASVSGTREFNSQLSLYSQNMLDSIYARFEESNRELLARYRPEIAPDVAFPRIIYDTTSDFSDMQLLLHGFHLTFESINSSSTKFEALEKEFYVKVNQVNQLKHKVANLELQVEALLKHHHDIKYLWEVTMEHDRSIKYLQSQINFHNLLNRPFQQVKRVIDWITNRILRHPPERK
jgi:hypothetical protein